MQSQVYVQYTGIGGTNMDSGIMPMISGSSNPSVHPGSEEKGINISWTYPGGITDTKLGENADIGWGHALAATSDYATGNTDDDITAWLMGRSYGGSLPPNPPLTQTEIEAESPRIATELNRLIDDYMQRLFQPGLEGDYTSFKDYYSSCIYVHIV